MGRCPHLAGTCMSSHVTVADKFFRQCSTIYLETEQSHEKSSKASSLKICIHSNKEDVSGFASGSSHGVIGGRPIGNRVINSKPDFGKLFKSGGLKIN